MEAKIVWHPVSELPEVKEGDFEYIMLGFAFRFEINKRKGIVYGGAYLNQYNVMNENTCEEEPWTGFHEAMTHPDFDEFFEPIKIQDKYRELVCWAYYPEVPENFLDNIKPAHQVKISEK